MSDLFRYNLELALGNNQVNKRRGNRSYEIVDYDSAWKGCRELARHLVEQAIRDNDTYFFRSSDSDFWFAFLEIDKSKFLETERVMKRKLRVRAILTQECSPEGWFGFHAPTQGMDFRVKTFNQGVRDHFLRAHVGDVVGFVGQWSAVIPGVFIATGYLMSSQIKKEI